MSATEVASAMAFPAESNLDAEQGTERCHQKDRNRSVFGP
jgi:hypothetical protein